jgi:hypothetical protein
MGFCGDWAAAANKCGFNPVDQAQCFDLVKLLSDSAVQAADNCTTKVCNLLDQCITEALPFQCEGTTAGSSSGGSSGSSTSTSSGGGTSGGTSGSTSGGSTSGGTSGSTSGGITRDAGSGSGSDGGSSSGSTFDGTTGQPCTTDAQCKGVGPGAPGINRCSTSVLFNGGELYPTGVCLMPVKCDPCGGTTPCDNLIHGCDGVDPAAPGVCLPTGSGGGVCLPVCSFKADGSPPVGCVGKDACNAYGFEATTTPASGIGYCFGGCTADADCIAGEKCDTTTGLCQKTVTPPSKAFGSACTMADATMNPPSCNCIYNTTTNLGFCTSFCTVGGTQCPTGWFCETEEPRTLPSAGDGSVAGFSSENTGLGGFCVPSCQVGAPGACPPNTACQATFAGGSGCIP